MKHQEAATSFKNIRGSSHDYVLSIRTLCSLSQSHETVPCKQCTETKYSRRKASTHATTLAHSLSNAILEMFYKHVRPEISTD
jgi:hypothetical protein